jgi:chemotaxis methyl-accepting protein methylase
LRSRLWKRRREKGVSLQVEIGELDSLLEKVYREGGYDFRDYRRGTVIRRLERRLHATKTNTCPDYIQFLDTHPEEYEKLAECLTIKVSGFFRSSYAFEQITRRVLPDLVSEKRKRQDYSLRVWSTACARGEEPYSIAILLAEFLGHQRQNFNISIHATDISRQALNEAKSGIYSPQDVEGLSDTILGNYFNHVDERYEVRADIKQMLHFSYFDLTSLARPPFMNLDLIFCCNVLIFLQKPLQKRVLEMLYDSLRSLGYLILGESETPLANQRAKLECIDRKAKIYRKVETAF